MINVEAHIERADYPAVNNPLPNIRLPDLQLTIAVDVYGVEVPATAGMIAIPDVLELSELLAEPIAAAIAAALA
jgi:hypothetical protein